MLDQIFEVDRQDNLLQLNKKFLLENTDQDFFDLCSPKLDDLKISELKFGGDRRSKFVYFKAGTKHFSFSDNSDYLLFSEQIKKKWKLVVGWKKQK